MVMRQVLRNKNGYSRLYSFFFIDNNGATYTLQKDDCQELFQSINLIGGKVDFLDPIEFVGPEQGKMMTNRIIGVDDGVSSK